MNLQRHILAILLVQLWGCAFTPVILQPDEVNFSKVEGEWIGWAVYEIGRDFEDIDLELALRSAKAGLLYADMEIVDVNIEQLWVAGKRGVTLEYLYTPNPAGATLYLKKTNSGVLVKLVYSLPKPGPSIRTSDATYGIRIDINNIFEGMSAFIKAERRATGVAP